MEYLLLAILSIIIYAEILPTISLGFEWLRTWLASKIAILQLKTAQIQEDIQEVQARMEPQQTQAIGFQVNTNKEEENENE